MSTLSKWKFSASLIAVILAAAPSSLVSQAQFVDASVVVNVPFAFGDGSQNFAAGRYSIAMNEQKILAIRSGFKLWFCHGVVRARQPSGGDVEGCFSQIRRPILLE